MSSSLQDKVELGLGAMERHSWEEARRLLAEVDAEGGEGLRRAHCDAVLQTSTGFVTARPAANWTYPLVARSTLDIPRRG